MLSLRTCSSKSEMQDHGRGARLLHSLEVRDALGQRRGRDDEGRAQFEPHVGRFKVHKAWGFGVVEAVAAMAAAAAETDGPGGALPFVPAGLKARCW